MNHKLTYGTLSTGTPTGNDHEGYHRMDTYTPDDGRAPLKELCLAASQTDDTPTHSGAYYDSKCDACCLNITHTEAYHAEGIK